jgi:hypothetical protein
VSDIDPRIRRRDLRRRQVRRRRLTAAAIACLLLTAVLAGAWASRGSDE